MLKNPHTGEVAIDGTDAHLIFTAESFTWMEQVLGVGTMQLLQKAATLDLSMTETQVILSSGMEAWRRRNGNQGKPVTPAKALKVIEKGGGLLACIGHIAESFEACPALGLPAQVKKEEEEAEPDPTIGDESSPESSLPEFVRPTPGS